MSEIKERAEIIREALKKSRLCIRATAKRTGPGFVAVAMRGERDTVPDGPFLVDGKSLSFEGETLSDAIALCEDAVMDHLSVNPAPLSGDDEMRAQMAAMAAEIAALKAANAPAPAAPPKPPKPSKPEPASA